MIPSIRIVLVAAALVTTLPTWAEQQDWIARSDQHAAALLQIMAKYNAESAATLGVEGHDADIIDLKPQYVERQESDLEAVAKDLQSALAAESDPREDVYRLAVEKGWVLRELGRESMTLEDVFVRLTRHEEAAAPEVLSPDSATSPEETAS